MLTIAKMHGDSVAYYEATVVEGEGADLGPDGYYSEDGTRPAEAWIVSRTDEKTAEVSQSLGVVNGARVDGKSVREWFNNALAPSGQKLGRAPKGTGVPGFDLTFCAPKSVSLVWGLTDDPVVRAAVDAAHQRAVSAALSYLAEHAGYTRRADDFDRDLMIIDRVEAISGVKYEHRTSRAGDPHVHSHVLLSNKQLCRDRKWRTLDGVSLYHEARAAGTIYQAVLREEISRELGVKWSETVNGCAEISGLDDRHLIEEFSTRAREIDQWRRDNGLADSNALERVAQKQTRQTKDLETPLSALQERWKTSEAGVHARAMITGLSAGLGGEKQGARLPSTEEILAAVTAEQSTFTRADVVETVAELIPVGAVDTDQVTATIERLTSEVFAGKAAWTVTPEKSRLVDKTAREGSQRFTSEAVVAEVDRGIDLATEVIAQGVSAEMIQPEEGVLSRDQAEAMRAVVSSRYRASTVIAPAGAGKTSSLKAARRAWEQAGKTVVGLAPTGKAADVMVGEQVAHSSSTLARLMRRVEDASPAEAAAVLGWDESHVVVVDEAGMVASPEIVRVLEIAAAAQARVVLVGDPYQYGAVKSRGGMLATLAHELPDAVELTEVFRQSDPAEREASKRLRTGELPDVNRAAQFYAQAGRLHAGSVTAMLDDALAGWRSDIEAGKQSLLVASHNDYVDALNRAAQKTMAERGALDLSEAVQISSSQFAHVGDTLLTRRNSYDLITSKDDVVRNGQRWQVGAINSDGSVDVRRLDDTSATVTLSHDYLRQHVQLGYASTGHSAQGATVDVARVVAGVGQIGRAGVYVPMTRGREGNYLYMAEAMPGDTETGHGKAEPHQRRESTDYARDLLIQAATRSHADQTPHEVHRQARRDWTLTRLSQNLPTSATPFSGTRMARVADAREEARTQRLHDFYAVPTREFVMREPTSAHTDSGRETTYAQDHQRKRSRREEYTRSVGSLDAEAGLLQDSDLNLADSTHRTDDTSESSPKSTRTSHDNPYARQLEQAKDEEERLRVHADALRAQVEEMSHQRNEISGAITQSRQEMNRLDRLIRDAEYRRRNRGFFAKMFRSDEDLDQIYTWQDQRAELEQEQQRRAEHLAVVEEDLEELRGQYSDASDAHNQALTRFQIVKAWHFTADIHGGISPLESIEAQLGNMSHEEEPTATAWSMDEDYSLTDHNDMEL